MYLQAKVIIESSTSVGEGEKGWRQYDIGINLSRYSTKPKGKTMERTFRLGVPPGNPYEPVPGDQLKVRQLERGVWMPVTSFFNGIEDYQYVIPQGGKTTFQIGEKDVQLYRMPDFAVISHLEIKLVACWYNPLTDEETCKVVTNDHIYLDELQPDSFRFALYERTRTTHEAQALGDWYRFHEAYEVMDYLNNTLLIMRRLSNK